LGAIQAVAVSVGLPFTMIMIVMMISLYLGLHGDYKKMKI
jgi:BCCT family betaine/carnitine transporter